MFKSNFNLLFNEDIQRISDNSTSSQDNKQFNLE